jgi:ABC-type nitrate/sulfonate/bicarbonate transport system substrate-binding protein
MAVTDCAPLVYAHESGLFDEYEVAVELVRESTWANIRDKVIYGELDAAHAPATLPFLANLGLESDVCACVSALVLSLQGNAITVSNELWQEGVRDAETLRELIYRHWGKRTFTFGVVFPISAAYFLLRQWLQSADIVPETELRIVTVPPEQMFPTLKLGYLDGCCVGEPWTSVLAQSGVGHCITTSMELAPLHPETVLMTCHQFATERAEEHERLLAALLEACVFCDRPRNRLLLSELLVQPRYVNAPAESLKAGLLPQGERAAGGLPELAIFHRHNANEPSEEKAAWIIDQLYQLLSQSPFRRPTYGRAPVLKNVFRRDIYERARARMFRRVKGRPLRVVSASA